MNESVTGWLRENCGTLGDVSQNNVFELKSVQDLPKLVRAYVFIPGDTREPLVLMTQLVTQNGFMPNRWSLVSSRNGVDREGTFLSLRIPEEDASLIRSRGGRLAFDFGSVIARLSGTSSVSEEIKSDQNE